MIVYLLLGAIILLIGLSLVSSISESQRRRS